MKSCVFLAVVLLLAEAIAIPINGRYGESHIFPTPETPTPKPTTDVGPPMSPTPGEPDPTPRPPTTTPEEPTTDVGPPMSPTPEEPEPTPRPTTKPTTDVGPPMSPTPEEPEPTPRPTTKPTTRPPTPEGPDPTPRPPTTTTTTTLGGPIDYVAKPNIKITRSKRVLTLSALNTDHYKVTWTASFNEMNLGEICTSGTCDYKLLWKYRKGIFVFTCTYQSPWSSLTAKTIKKVRVNGKGQIKML